MTLLTALVSHLGPAEVHSNIEHLRTVAPNSPVALCHGGSHEDFEAIEHEHKLFIEEPGLRSEAATVQSYTEALHKVFAAYVAPNPAVAAVLLMEFDQIPLDGSFYGRLNGLLEETGADFLGKGCSDRTATNWWHRVRYRDDPSLLKYLARLSVRRDPQRLLGCLGTGFIMRRKVLEAFAAVDHLPGIYVELYLPTLVHHLGFRTEDVDRVSGLYENVRWTPPYELKEVLQLKRSGATVVHPFKSAADLPALRSHDTIPPAR